MEDIASLMAEDAAEQGVRIPRDEKLANVADLANEQLRLEAAVVEQEKVLKELREALANVQEFELPNALEALGLASVSLKDGSRVSVKENVHTSIKEENKAACFEWCLATGNDGLIKNEIKLPFGKNQDADADEAAAFLTEKGYSFTQAKSIHPSTLKAFVTHSLEDGLPIPMDLFSVFIQKTSRVERPK